MSDGMQEISSREAISRRETPEEDDIRRMFAASKGPEGDGEPPLERRERIAPEAAHDTPDDALLNASDPSDDLDLDAASLVDEDDDYDDPEENENQGETAQAFDAPETGEDADTAFADDADDWPGDASDGDGWPDESAAGDEDGDTGDRPDASAQFDADDASGDIARASAEDPRADPDTDTGMNTETGETDPAAPSPSSAYSWKDAVDGAGDEATGDPGDDDARWSTAAAAPAATIEAEVFDAAEDGFERLGDSGPRRPRIALMGEFSAGKSTLTNLLIGEQSLPMKVTATQLPPVWITHGAGQPYAVDRDTGEAEEIEESALDAVEVEDTGYVRLYREAEMLKAVDLIDMPGISDPNMDPEVWESVIEHADAVIWLTHATQAWRQSEAAVWDSLPETLYDRSILLVTRFDKITSADDRRRLMARIEKETRGRFSARFPIALLDALHAGDDRERWEASGAEAFTEALTRLIETLSSDRSADGAGTDAALSAWEGRAPRPAAAPAAAPRRLPRPENAARVMPSRVRAPGGGGRQRYADDI